MRRFSHRDQKLIECSWGEIGDLGLGPEGDLVRIPELVHLVRGYPRVVHEGGVSRSQVNKKGRLTDGRIIQKCVGFRDQLVIKYHVVTCRSSDFDYISIFICFLPGQLDDPCFEDIDRLMLICIEIDEALSVNAFSAELEYDVLV